MPEVLKQADKQEIWGNGVQPVISLTAIIAGSWT